VAAGQRDAVAGDEIITAPASNGGYNIKSFDVNGKGNSPTVVDNFFAFGDRASIGGLSIAAANLNGNLTDDLVIGTTAGRFGIFNDNNINPIYNSNPFTGFNGPVRVGVSSNGTKNFAIATAGPGGGPVVTSFNNVGNIVTSLFILDVAFTGGLFSSPSIGSPL